MDMGLGLYMKKNLFLLTLFLLPSLMSCLSAEPEETPFGDEVSAQSVADALNEPFQTLTPLSIKKGEFSHIETSQSISGGTRFVTQDTGITVIDRQETSDNIRLTLAVQEVNYSSDGSSESTVFEENIDLAKSSSKPEALTKTFTSSSSSPSSLIAQSLQAKEVVAICQPSNSSSVTYHNLSVSKTQKSAPTLVQNSSFCSGQPSCQLNVTDIRFDQVVKDGDGSIKIACEYSYATNAPFLSGQLKQCTTMAIPVDGRSVIVTECAEILNFTLGSG